MTRMLSPRAISEPTAQLHPPSRITIGGHSRLTLPPTQPHLVFSSNQNAPRRVHSCCAVVQVVVCWDRVGA